MIRGKQLATCIGKREGHGVIVIQGLLLSSNIGDIQVIGIHTP